MKKRLFIFLTLLFILVSALHAISATTGEFTIGEHLYCGDGIVSGNEECDSSNLSGHSCGTRGYSIGTLACTADCMFDEYDCRSTGGGGGGTTTTQCNDGKDNDGDKLIDLEDPGCSNTLDNSEEDKACYISWDCSDWSECINGTRTRICTDLNHCNLESQEIETDTCTPIEIFLPKPFDIIITPECMVYGFPCWLIALLILTLSMIIYKLLTKEKKKKHRRKKRKS